MKAFVDWVLAGRYRLIVLAAVFAPLLQVVTIALIALDTMRRGLSQASVGAAIALLGLLVVASLTAALTGASPATIGWIGFGSFAAGLGLGWLLRWAGGLAGAFQGVVLFCVVAVVAISVIGPGPEVLFAPMLDGLVELLRENQATDQQIEAFREAQPVMFGLFAAALLVQLIAALFLAYWWNGLAAGDSRFGTEFRDLKLSRALGFPASLLVAFGLVLDAPLVQNLTPLALFGFVFQGLAVMHAWAYAKGWHVGLLVPVYVLLITPLISVIILGLSAVGLVDNWFDLRAPLRPRA
ncbi:MAG: hypothetical protein JXB36_06790 [Gammaproteobacteria bacterium]|nr:hypothetical protein [Gammaproteobacteria bacterium]